MSGDVGDIGPIVKGEKGIISNTHVILDSNGLIPLFCDNRFTWPPRKAWT